MQISTGKINYNLNKDGSLTIIEKKNYTLEDLKQKLINEFYQKPANYCYDERDIELLKILFG